MKTSRYRLFSFAMFWTILIILFGGLAGCSSANEASMEAFSEAGDRAMPQSAPVEAEASAEESMLYADGDSVAVEDFLGAAVAQAQETRVIIYTGDIALVVKDTQAAVDEITALSSELDGFVSGSNVYESGDVLRGSVLRLHAVSVHSHCRHLPGE